MTKLNPPGKLDEIIIGNSLNLKIKAVPIRFKDLAYTRDLKNFNRSYFFFSKTITWPRHLAWWLQYKKELNNYFYVIKIEDINYGTFAIKLMDNRWNIYSVIRDKRTQYRPRAMKETVLFILNFFVNFGEIHASVLISNKALYWYYSIGFEEIEKFQNYITLRYILKKELI
jgi:hypothetical protein